VPYFYIILYFVLKWQFFNDFKIIIEPGVKAFRLFLFEFKKEMKVTHYRAGAFNGYD